MAFESQPAPQTATIEQRGLRRGSAPRGRSPAGLARLTGGGTAGNERLTAATGVLLLVLLAVLGVTIVRIGSLLSVHMFLGMLLIGPVVLKLGSTGYRFMRYYTANPPYRHKGPPALPLRVLAPLVVLSTVVVFASGVALLLIGPSSRGSLLLIHKASFIVWGACTAVHVLGHLPDLPEALRNRGKVSRELGADRAGAAGRSIALVGMLVLGLVLALLVLPDFAPWLNGHFHHHH